jgi:hypothetical protein
LKANLLVFFYGAFFATADSGMIKNSSGFPQAE